MYNSARYAVVVLDYGAGVDSVGVEAYVTVNDVGCGIEGDVLVAATCFFVTEESTLHPLGVLVIGDSRKDLLPGIREFVEKIPGLHGEIDFGTKLEPRLMELHVATEEGLTPTQREQLKRTIAKHLNPVAGTKTLVFGDELNKIYHVKYAGKIPLDQFPDWFEFTIPFKMSDPYITETFERSLVGSGTITNFGNTDTCLLIEIAGPDENPTVTIGGSSLAYTGTIAEGKTLSINTETLEAEINGENAIGGITGDIDMRIPPGNALVTAGPNVTIKWKSRWV